MPRGQIITISRQIGSGGAFLGRQVAKRLGLRYLDREILRRAARELRVEEESLAQREERMSSFWENFSRSLTLGIPEAGYVPPPISMVNDEALFAVEADVIRKAAEEGGAVIVGRGGFHILRERPGVVNVFLHADREFRRRRVESVYGIGEASKAEELVEESDRERRRFVEAMTGTDWTDTLNYHLTIDTGVAGLATAEEVIIRFCATATGCRPA